MVTVCLEIIKTKRFCSVYIIWIAEITIKVSREYTNHLLTDNIQTNYGKTGDQLRIGILTKCEHIYKVIANLCAGSQFY